jgi:hypothetical protein
MPLTPVSLRGSIVWLAVIGSTRYLDIALPHRRVEIGATWLAPSTQRTGANVEAKAQAHIVTIER